MSVEEKVKSIVAKQLGLGEDEVNNESSFTHSPEKNRAQLFKSFDGIIFDIILFLHIYNPLSLSNFTCN